MLITKKMLLTLTLVGALVGAGIGVLFTRSAQGTSAANTTSNDAAQTTKSTEKTPDQIAAENSLQFRTTQEQTAYRQGFGEGYNSCSTAGANTSNSTVAYRSSTNRAPVRRSSKGRQVYYDYASTPRGRTFWQKHRDKLTVAAGSGAGALVGGLLGGKKGAGIGLLGGGVGSALYTYKLRNRTRQ